MISRGNCAIDGVLAIRRPNRRLFFALLRRETGPVSSRDPCQPYNLLLDTMPAISSQDAACWLATSFGCSSRDPFPKPQLASGYFRSSRSIIMTSNPSLRALLPLHILKERRKEGRKKRPSAHGAEDRTSWCSRETNVQRHLEPIAIQTARQQSATSFCRATIRFHDSKDCIPLDILSLLSPPRLSFGHCKQGVRESYSSPLHWHMTYHTWKFHPKSATTGETIESSSHDSSYAAHSALTASTIVFATQPLPFRHWWLLLTQEPTWATRKE